MPLFRRTPAGVRDAVQLGRAHEVPAEIHYSSGTDRWWYHGELWVTETKAVRGYELDPDLTDPRNGPILARMEQGLADEQIAGWLLQSKETDTRVPGLLAAPYEVRLKRALAVIRRVRWARDHASDPHTVRLYGFRNASKEEERILASVDQDLIAEAPMVPYTQTEKGWRRVQLVLFIGMAIAYAVLIGTTLSFTSNPAVTEASAQAATAQLESTLSSVVELAAIPGVALLVWWFMARRTRVIDLQVQPLVGTMLDAHTEPVFLTNSTKTPASMYLSHVLRVGTEGIEALATAVRNFETDTIAQQREQIASLRSQIDSAKLTGLDSLNENLDLAALSGRRAPAIVAEGNLGMMILTVLIAVVVTGAVVYAVMASGG
jgi:hypothetical protein